MPKLEARELATPPRDQDGLAAWQALVKDLVGNKPATFAKLMCEGVLAEPGTPGAMVNRPRDHTRRVYRQLAQLTLRSMTGSDRCEDREQLTVAEWISEDFDGSSRFDFLNYAHFEDARSTAELIFTFFGPLIDALSNSVANAAQLVYHGVPVYEKIGDKNLVVDDSTDTVVYLRERGSRYEVVQSAEIPEWAERLSFLASHIKTHDVFFPPTEHVPSPEEVAQLRAAYRHMIGLPLGSSELKGRRFSSKLLVLVEAVCARYYGANFVPSDSGSWPRQKDVVAWLKEKHGLSEREAQAIDIVCRPDALRGK